MTKKEIYILTGPIHSGKTTGLQQWIGGQKNVYGILTPVIASVRMFMNANTQEVFSMEAKEFENNVLKVGKYSFSTAAFDRAINILKNALQQNEGWLIIDEVGPLELKGEGFHDAIQEILHANTRLKIVFVVRDSLWNEVIKFFELKKCGDVEVKAVLDFSLQ